MNRMSYVLLAAVLLIVFPEVIHAHNPESLAGFEQRRQSINQTGMLVLGSWALGNILSGSYGHFNTSGQARYFHQMNAMWNLVNLGIATFGYFGAAGSDPLTMSASEIVREYVSFQNILILNAGLDVAYMTAGLYLRERSRNVSRHNMLIGYGNSIILQGAFLFVFDIVLYFIHRSQASINLYPVLGFTDSNVASFGVGIVF